MKNNINKNGISLIVLVITIVVALILVATVVISTSGAIDSANVTAFAKDLNDIEEATTSYYILNGVIPVLDGEPVRTSASLLSIAGNEHLLNEEITEKGDADSQFYTIDLAKINVTKIAYGNKDYGENDIFVVAYPTMNVYYPYGIEANGTLYFSLTSKITSVSKIIEEDINSSSTTVITSGGIKVTKNNGWANKMGINIDVNMGSGDTLYMSVSGGTNKEITTALGKNTFGFDLLSDIVANKETIKVPFLTIEEANYIEAGTKPVEERYVDILKYNSGDILGKVRVNLSNFSKSLPTIINADITSYTSSNSTTLNLSSSESGIREVRYEYLKKFKEDGTIVDYYDGVTDFDEKYMKNNSKKAKLLNGAKVTISTPKDVQSIKVAIIDKAGNINIYTQKAAPNLYIGYTKDIATTESLQLTANIYSTNGVKTVSFSKSTDGLNYTDEQVYNLDFSSMGVKNIQCTPYTGGFSGDVYVKIVASNLDSTITETRIVTFNIGSSGASSTDLGVKVITLVNRPYSTAKLAAYNNPVVPKGFAAINDGTTWPTDWNKGLVIEDLNGNQFVWVPVDGSNVPYEKNFTYPSNYGATEDNTEDDTADDTLPAGVNNEQDQITKYGGFYIARYEAGNASNILVSKKDSTVWNNINYTNSVAKSKIMYIAAEVKSGLITGTQWDTVMNWISNDMVDVKSVTDSSVWGNYSGGLKTTGGDSYKAKNIYDLAGNVWEWTSEVYGSSLVTRGGRYSDSGSDFPASYRHNFNPANSLYDIGFRPVLYVQ